GPRGAPAGGPPRRRAAPAPSVLPPARGLMNTATSTRTVSATVRDMIALTKPRITLMVVITAAGSAWLASQSLPEGQGLSPLRMLTMLATVAMVVGGANTLNCYLERDSDRFM